MLRRIIKIKIQSHQLASAMTLTVNNQYNLMQTFRTHKILPHKSKQTQQMINTFKKMTLLIFDKIRQRKTSQIKNFKTRLSIIAMSIIKAKKNRICPDHQTIQRISSRLLCYLNLKTKDRAVTVTLHLRYKMKPQRYQILLGRVQIKEQ